MPYDWEGNYIESKADKYTERLGFGEIGGVGQLIYTTFRFSDYDLRYDTNGTDVLMCPICNEKNPPVLRPKDTLTGKEILTSLCTLAKRIDDFNEKPHQVLIVEWCKENMHPYSIDYLYEALSEKEFDVAGIEAEFLAKDGIFSIKDFMLDLEKLYNAARFYLALEGVAFAIRDNLEIAKTLGINITKSTACGGGAKSKLWLKILANVLNIDILIPEVEEGPGVGAAMLAMVACGEYENIKICAEKLVKIKETLKPDKAIAELYEKQYRKHVQIYPALKDLYKNLK